MKKWIGMRGDVNHNAIYLAFSNERDKNPRHFKFKSIWIKGEEFKEPMAEVWYLTDLGSQRLDSMQFSNNVKEWKHATVK